MKTRILIVLMSVSAALIFTSIGTSFAKTASCPCSPCKCSPCTCGGGGGKGDKQHDKEGHHEHTGGVGASVNVDLGGVGQRRAESDPFAVAGGGSSNTSHTQEKHRTKTRAHDVATTDPFNDIHLTGQPAKEQALADAAKH